MARHRLGGEDTAIIPAQPDAGTSQWGNPAGSPPGRTLPLRGLAIVAACVMLVAVVALAWGSKTPMWNATPPTTTPTSSQTQPVPDTGSSVPSASLTATPSARPSAGASASQRRTPGASPSLTSTPVPTQVNLVAGSTRSLESISLAGTYVTENAAFGDLMPVTTNSAATTKQAATFTVVAGLANPTCVSFLTASGNYLRHRNFRLRVEPLANTGLFRQDTTFCVRPGNNAGSVSFESVNYPGWYLHHRAAEIWLEPLADNAAFRTECSFRAAYGWV